MIDFIEFDAWQIVLAARRLAHIADADLERVRDDLDEAVRLLAELQARRKQEAA